MASIPRQLPQQVSDLTSPPVGQRQGSRISRPWYDWALWVSQQITGLLDGDGVVIPPGTITFTQTDVVLGRKSPGAGVGEEITFTDQAQQLADDTSFAQMRATLGIDASTTPYTPSDVGYWGGSDPGEVDDALNYLALNGVHVPTTLAADEKFLVPTDRQCLYAATITVDGTLTVDGDLIEVQTEAVQVLGTTNEITSTQSGYTYTVSLPASLTFTGKTVTDGTFNNGAFNGTLGATTPSSIVATSINTTGTLTVGDGVGSATLLVNAQSGTVGNITLQQGGLNNWQLRNPSTGLFSLQAYDLATGTLIDNVVTVANAAGGSMTINRPIRTNIDGSATAVSIGRTAGNGVFFGTNIIAFATTNTEAGRIDSSRRLLWGLALTARTVGVASAAIQQEGLTFAGVSTSMLRHSSSPTQYAVYTFGKTAGSAIGDSTAVTAGHILGSLEWAAGDGTDVTTLSSYIRTVAEGTISPGIVPGYLTFGTANASGVRTEGLRVNSSQQTLHADGTVSLPGRSYISDPDTGSYRIGANNEGFSAGGTLQFEYSANGFFTRRANHGAAVTLTTSTTLDSSHETVWVDATGGAITITVPAASGRQYRKYNIYKVDSSANVVTVARSGSDNVMFVTSFALNAQGEGLNIQSDGSANWYPYA